MTIPSHPTDAPTPERTADPTPEAMPDYEIVRLWREAGGGFYGPHVEHADMEYAKWLPFMRAFAKAARAQGEARATLFVDGEFTAHSGDTLPFKIDCDALTDADIATLAADVARRLKFSCVVGVPRGGIRLQDALAKYLQPGYGTLIVDDVLTTGRSMEEYRQRFDNSTSPKPIQGAVIFARGPCPDWITPLFGDFAQGEAKGRAEMREEAARVADEHGKLHEDWGTACDGDRSRHPLPPHPYRTGFDIR